MEYRRPNAGDTRLLKSKSGNLGVHWGCWPKQVWPQQVANLLPSLAKSGVASGSNVFPIWPKAVWAVTPMCFAIPWNQKGIRGSPCSRPSSTNTVRRFPQTTNARSLVKSTNARKPTCGDRQTTATIIRTMANKKCGRYCQRHNHNGCHSASTPPKLICKCGQTLERTSNSTAFIT